jgi:hypothetical protein
LLALVALVVVVDQAVLIVHVIVRGEVVVLVVKDFQEVLEFVIIDNQIMHTYQVAAVEQEAQEEKVQIKVMKDLPQTAALEEQQIF